MGWMGKRDEKTLEGLDGDLGVIFLLVLWCDTLVGMNDGGWAYV